MTVAQDISRPGQVILARLLVPPKSGLTAVKIVADLSELNSDSFKRKLVDLELEHLQAQGLIEPIPAKTAVAGKGRSSRNQKLAKEPAYQLATQGRDWILRLLGLSNLPPKLTWKKLKANYLTRVSLSAAKEARIDGKSLELYLLRQQMSLEVGENTTRGAVMAAAVCTLLGYPGATDFRTLQARVLERHLGIANPLSLNDVFTQFVRKRLGAKRGTPDELRRLSLQRWLAARDLRVPEDKLQVHSSSVSDDPRNNSPFSLPEFARAAVTAARQCETGWFGDNKVFISHAWKAFKALENGRFHLDLMHFKKELIRANTAGLLQLSRADLVSFMDPVDVRESEALYLNTSFHFILLERGRS